MQFIKQVLGIGDVDPLGGAMDVPAPGLGVGLPKVPTVEHCNTLFSR